MDICNITAAQAQIGRRKQGRLRVRLAARIITLDGTAHAVLADVSRWGARVEGVFAGLRHGQDVVVIWSGHDVFGTIVWLNETLCGIMFDEPVADAALVSTRRIDDRDRLPEGKPMERELARREAWIFVSGWNNG